ncbi:MAG: TonB-dependent receptor [Pseudomonadota bacterium]
MQKTSAPQKHLLAAAIAALCASGAAMAQTAAAPVDPSSTVVVTGTRVANRSVLDTSAPVDVISADSLKQSGSTEINQALAVALPSLNFPRPGLADGTDTIRPATLRGMGPDQTLVLVNSKRRHASALVNVNGTIGRGSAAVDLNTIPTAIVKTIEVLRDGAAAQYGSDAISGVVNLRLRTNRSGGEASVTYGARNTEYDVIPSGAAPAGNTWSANAPTSRKRNDGETATVSIWKGLPLGEAGFLTIAAEFKDQQRTERGGYDLRQQYPLVAGAFDPREQTFDRYNSWYGEPEMKQATLFANAGSDLGGGMKLYGWASYQKRDARSAGFYRIAQDVRNVPSIYPNGFLPLIAPTVDDASATGGMTWTMGNWDMDVSLGYGKNKMQFTIENTLNRSLGAASKTAFDAGGFSYDQMVLNLTGVRTLPVAAFDSPLNIAVGAETRREGYTLFAGEPDSYRNGGVLLPSGLPTASGAQVFPGFRPTDASDHSRTATGVFADFEANVTKKLLASFALRGEHYSDFGNSLAGKLAARYDISNAIGLRSSLQNGFRAPSPQQQFFTTTSTNFVNGIPLEITTFRPSDAAAIALGAKPLDAEKSLNLSLGSVMRFGKATLTVDAYRIKIKDRIVLSENLNSAPVVAYLASKGFAGVGGARFFINGVDTTTQGLDVVLNYPMQTAAAGKFDFTLAGNVTDTKVTRVPTTAQVSAINPAPTLFGRINTLSFEEGQPKNKLNASVNWKLGKLGATLRATRYGEVLSPGTSAALDFRMAAKTVVDLETRFALTPQINLALGADNLFDAYPEAQPPALNTTGTTLYSNYAPFGRSGRFIYAKASYSF